MINSQPKVAIVTVLALDSSYEVVDFLNEISKIEYPNKQLIIVNNNPGFEWLPSLIRKYDDIILINSGGNVGVCKAYNIGIKRAIKEGADYSMLLNRDVKISKHIVTELLRVFKNDDNAAMVSPIIMKYYKPGHIDFAGGFFNSVFYYLKINRSKSVFNNKEIIPINSINGCCVMIKSALMRKIGYFDEDLFLYFDDPEISIRVYNAGYKCYLLPKPLVKHLKKSTKFAPYEAYYFGRNPFIMIHKHARGIFKITGYFGQFLIRLPRNAIRMQSTRSFWMYLIGIRDGIKGVTGKSKYFK